MRYIQVLSELHIRQAVEQSHELWGGKLDLDARTKLMHERLKTAGPQFHFFSGLVDSNDNLVCSLKRYYFHIYLGETVHNCIGLGAIFTAIEHRKRGFAEKLIEHVLSDSVRNHNCTLALLYSDIGLPYYTKLGFKAYPAEHFKYPASTISPGGPRIELTGLDVRKGLELYDKYSSGFYIRPKRNALTWTFFRQLNKCGEDYSVKVDGCDAGFITAHPFENYLWIDECIAHPKFQEVIWSAVISLASKFKVKEIQGWPTPLLRLPMGTVVQPRKNAIPMLRSLNPSLTLDFKESDFYVAPVDHF